MPDREKLIEMSRQLRYCAVDDDCINCERWEVDCGSRKCLDDLLLKAAELLESVANGVTVQEWISVKDRLPEEPLQTVLVTNGSSVCVGVYSVVYEEFGVMYGRGQDKRFGVTHWMPLPQPPKGE